MVVAEGNVSQGDLPISITLNGHVCEASSIRAVVGAAEGELPSVLFRGSQPELKDWLIYQPTVYHVVENRCDAIDRNGVEAKTKNTVKPAERRNIIDQY